MELDADRPKLSPEEVRRAFARLRRDDIVRLVVLAGNWARGWPRHRADDLLDEAFDRVLSGRRVWPAEVSMLNFMSQVMRSIARQWRDQETRERAVLAEGRCDTAGCEAKPEEDYVTSDLTKRMREAIAEDPEASAIFDSILCDQDKAEAQEELGFDDKTWDTARRRMVRRLFDTFKTDCES